MCVCFTNMFEILLLILSNKRCLGDFNLKKFILLSLIGKPYIFKKHSYRNIKISKILIPDEP